MEVSVAYLLESKYEAERLEEQEKIKAYSLESELQNLMINENDKILDAGCGHGMASRFIKNSYNCFVSGCDFSEIRVAQAKKASSDNINFFHLNLESIESHKESYDFILSRYVFEYLNEPVKVCDSFKKLLNPEGRILLIDFDGVTSGLKTEDDAFNKEMEFLFRDLPIDLNVGKKLSTFLNESGFSSVKTKKENYVFKGRDLDLELKNIKKRFAQAQPEMTKVLGTNGYKSFVNKYISYFKDPNSVYSFDKYMVEGQL